MTEEADKLRPVRLVINNSEEVPPPRGPDDDASRGERPPEEPQRIAGLPDGCPVTPLGVLGDVSYYLDDLKQLRAVPAREHSRLGVLALFGRNNDLLYRFWPRTNADGDITGWRPERASEALMASASRCGVWNPFERVRGCGSWLDESGSLILHCGDVVILADKRRAPGLIGRFVYPAAPAAPRPWGAMVPGGSSGPGQALLSILKSWNWRRGELDAMLLLGWIGAAMIAGAIDWRPVAWITGGKGTGKSTLHKLLQRLFDNALISVSDASAAGVWQKLGHATVPVAIDELEAEQDNRRGQAVVKLARQAASGGVVLRGGADHHGSEFTARSCFLFSSILIPPLLGQDRSRMAICELKELAGEAAPDLAPQKMRELGQQLLRRMLDRWPSWNDTWAIYRDQLNQVGHDARGADVFGTLLAAADLLLHDAEPNLDHARELAEQLQFSGLAEAEDALGDHEHCLQQILGSVLPLDGSSNKNGAGEWVRRANGGSLYDADAADAQRILGMYGLKVIQERGQAAMLAIANSHPGLARLFAGTHWASASGARGVWAQSLKRLPMAEASKKALWFGGGSSRATLIPIELCNLGAASDGYPQPAERSLDLN